ncbi:CBS domain-containing protein [Nitrosopumilus sp.]|uniref:CBS domain-containing protein n=1 Tax=Nitrosopumilus sp. TaxID=2024843 RepID=UPI00247B882C|nr:CBS domain-containing protein [Nitrosopumilus sp.]MCV0409392.1 CBS domain-containing protein [Nitrosopumilus sp.]
MGSVNKEGIMELTLGQLFPDTLTDTNCVFVDKDREIWVSTEMCAQYLESTIDALVVQDDGKSIGLVGGYDILDFLRKNPTRDSQYQHTTQEIMFKDVPQVTSQTKFKDLMDTWKNSRRAFAVIQNKSGSYSPVSARKMLEVGKKYKTDLSISSMPKKKIITFQGDEPLREILDLMFNNKTRKLLLGTSNQFISDRTILEGLSRILKFQKDIDNLLDVPINKFTFDHIKVLTEDLPFDKLCSVMNRMEHPYVIYKDIVVSPWDICLALSSEDLQKSEVRLEMTKKCPHCGKDVNF